MSDATDSPQPGGQGQVNERQVARIARAAALGCYGVIGVASGHWFERLGDVMGFGHNGISVRRDPLLEVTINVELAPGVPRETVLSNVAEAIRYTVQRDAGRSIDTLTVTADGR